MVCPTLISWDNLVFSSQHRPHNMIPCVSYHAFNPLIFNRYTVLDSVTSHVKAILERPNLVITQSWLDPLYLRIRWSTPALWTPSQDHSASCSSDPIPKVIGRLLQHALRTVSMAFSTPIPRTRMMAKPTLSYGQNQLTALNCGWRVLVSLIFSLWELAVVVEIVQERTGVVAGQTQKEEVTCNLLRATIYWSRSAFMCSNVHTYVMLSEVQILKEILCRFSFLLTEWGWGVQM